LPSTPGGKPGSLSRGPNRRVANWKKGRWEKGGEKCSRRLANVRGRCLRRPCSEKKNQKNFRKGDRSIVRQLPNEKTHRIRGGKRKQKSQRAARCRSGFCSHSKPKLESNGLKRGHSSESGHGKSCRRGRCKGYKKAQGTKEMRRLLDGGAFPEKRLSKGKEVECSPAMAKESCLSKRGNLTHIGKERECRGLKGLGRERAARQEICSGLGI